jgi:hypothetical protein
LFPAGPIRDTAAAFLSPGAPLYLAALAVFVIVISLAQWGASGRRGPPPWQNRPRLQPRPSAHR